MTFGKSTDLLALLVQRKTPRIPPEGLACPELLLGRDYASKIFYRFVSIIALFVEIFEFYNPNSSFRNPLVFDFCLRFTVSLNYMKHQPVSSSIELVPLCLCQTKNFSMNVSGSTM